MNGESPLVDTSVLIDYFEGIDCRESTVLDELLEQGPPPTTAAIIVQEYLQGLVSRVSLPSLKLTLNASIDSPRLAIRFIF